MLPYRQKMSDRRWRRNPLRSSSKSCEAPVTKAQTTRTPRPLPSSDAARRPWCLERLPESSEWSFSGPEMTRRRRRWGHRKAPPSLELSSKPFPISSAGAFRWPAFREVRRCRDRSTVRFGPFRRWPDTPRCWATADGGSKGHKSSAKLLRRPTKSLSSREVGRFSTEELYGRSCSRWWWWFRVGTRLSFLWSFFEGPIWPWRSCPTLGWLRCRRTNQPRFRGCPLACCSESLLS